VIADRHRELDQQEAAINAFVEAFKSRIIREKGELYRMAKVKLEHGKYLRLLKRMGVEPRTAQEYTQTLRELGDELANARHGAHFSPISGARWRDLQKGGK